VTPTTHVRVSQETLACLRAAARRLDADRDRGRRRPGSVPCLVTDAWVIAYALRHLEGHWARAARQRATRTKAVATEEVTGG
jgi:hypothetical protein